eukprot:m.241845 g.241845  ORF g.241845 m.241845 type:complete len:695 (+) comp26318_c0_seq7:64-2148(+)
MRGGMFGRTLKEVGDESGWHSGDEILYPTMATCTTLSAMAAVVGLQLLLMTHREVAPLGGFDDGCYADLPRMWLDARTKEVCTMHHVETPIGPDVAFTIVRGAVEVPTPPGAPAWATVPWCDEPLLLLGAVLGAVLGLVTAMHPITVWAWGTGIIGVGLLVTERHFWRPVCLALSVNFWCAIVWIACAGYMKLAVGVSIAAALHRGSVLLFPIPKSALFVRKETISHIESAASKVDPAALSEVSFGKFSAASDAAETEPLDYRLEPSLRFYYSIPVGEKDPEGLLQKVLAILGEPQSYSEFVDTFRDTKDEKMRGRMAWMCSRNGKQRIRLTLVDNGWMLFGVEAVEKHTIVRLLKDLEIEETDLEVQARFITQRLSFGSDTGISLDLDCCHLPNSDKVYIVIRVKIVGEGEFTDDRLSTLHELLAHANSKTSEVYCALGKQTGDENWQEQSYHFDIVPAFISELLTAAKKRTVGALLRPRKQPSSAPAMEPSKALLDRFMRDFDKLAAQYPFQYVVLAEDDESTPFHTLAEAREYQHRLEKPAIVGVLTEQAARVVKSAVRDQNAWWVDGVVVSHPDCGPCEPFRALIDTGCEEGVGCIPPSTFRTLMDARVEFDATRYRSSNSEVYFGKAFRKCTVIIGVGEWALLAKDVSVSYTETNEGASPHTPLLGFETLCHMRLETMGDGAELKSLVP